MHTQCPNCKTVFSLTEEALAAHQGMVRCGRCREVFNASWNLVDATVDPGSMSADSDESDASPDDEVEESQAAASPASEHDPRVNDPESQSIAEDNQRSSEENTTEVSPLVNQGADEMVAPLTTEELDFLDNRLETKTGSSPDDTEDAPPREIDPAADSMAHDADTAQTTLIDATAPSSGNDLSPDGVKPVEEIIIEPPSNLQVPIEEAATLPDGLVKGDEETVRNSPGLQHRLPKPAGSVAEQNASPRAPRPQTDTGSMTTMNLAGDVKMVEIPYPQPIKTAAWALGVLFLVLGIVWQIREFYLPDLSRITALRGPLIHFCDYVSCSVPPRSDMKSIDLVGTSVDPHPVTPGALRVSAHLVNRARFTQSFPLLEVTLTDKEGNVVGRRTYLPHEYREEMSNKMIPNVVERANFDLAQPADSAVGYEIQLVAR